MVSENGVHAAPMDLDEHADPTGVFARVGRTFPLGPKSVTIKLLTIRELKAQQDALNVAWSMGEFDSVAKKYFYGALRAEDGMPALATWLTCWTTEPVTAEDLEEALPDEVMALIEALFEQTGMEWVRRFLELPRPPVEMTPAPVPESETGGEGSASTSTTPSSSESPDPQPTPRSKRQPTS